MAVGLGEDNVSLGAGRGELSDGTTHLSLGQRLHHLSHQCEGNKCVTDWLIGTIRDTYYYQHGHHDYQGLED